MKATILFPIVAVYFLKACEITKGDLSYSNQFIPMSEKNVSLLESWEKMEKQLKYAVNAGMKMVLPYIIENLNSMKVSKECLSNCMHLIKGIKDIRPWAIRFLDSSAKFIDGLLTGTVTSLGAYDQCVNIEVLGTKFTNKGKLIYQGQYCMIDIRPHIPEKPYFFKLHDLPEELKNFSNRDTVVAELARRINYFHLATIRLAVCVPSGCSREDVSKIAKLVGDAVSMDAAVSRCEVKQEKEYTTTVLTVIACYSVLGFFMLVGTSIDVYAYYTKSIFKSKGMHILMSFSLWTNFKKFSNMTQEKISCLDGIRVLTMTWVIVGHTYILLNPRMMRHVENMEPLLKEIPFQAVANSFFSVETFLFMGGLLVSYLTIKYCVFKKQKFQISLYIILRIIRIFPNYIFIMISIFVMTLMSSGPLWHETVDPYIKDCTENWWTNLLFINNFHKATNQCLPHAWYIACDMQLYIGALLIIIPMTRWPRVGIGFAIFSIFACVFYSAFYTYFYNLPPTMLISNPDIEAFMTVWTKFYFRPFAHISSYSVGLLTGYILIMKPNFKISPVIQVLGWATAITLNMTVVYGITEWNRGVEPSRLSAALYAGTCRTIWSLGVAWMIICCATGHGGIINYILSWKIWIPLSRLTFLAYLVHPIVQFAYNGAFRSQISTDHYMIVWMILGHICVSYGVSFCLYMLVELPFTNIQKLFMPRLKKEEEIVIKDHDAFNVCSNDEKKEKNDDDCTVVHIVDKK